MKRLLLAAFAALVILPVTPAAASTSGAERAAKRYADQAYFLDFTSAFCDATGRGKYSCTVKGTIDGEYHHGTAQVRQYGSRYSVRLYMRD